VAVSLIKLSGRPLYQFEGHLTRGKQQPQLHETPDCGDVCQIFSSSAPKDSIRMGIEGSVEASIKMSIVTDRQIE
jgi:hypothetical protein